MQCDKCELWYHLFCIGLKPHDIKEDEDFVCKYCKVDTSDGRSKKRQNDTSASDMDTEWNVLYEIKKISKSCVYFECQIRPDDWKFDCLFLCFKLMSCTLNISNVEFCPNSQFSFNKLRKFEEMICGDDRILFVDWFLGRHSSFIVHSYQFIQSLQMLVMGL